ncbi:hypothetical protein HUJ05_013052 [Dendroctonus ponderosae]|nr:hypothetical protein HUJ05_013052 [Dendroctonus ponderosae]
MDLSEIQEICRLCSSDKGTGVLINVFDNDLKEHLKDVVLVTTGIHELAFVLVARLKIPQQYVQMLTKAQPHEFVIELRKLVYKVELAQELKPWATKSLC